MDSQDIRERYQQLLDDYHSNRIDWRAFERGLFELKQMRSSSADTAEEPPAVPAQQTELPAQQTGVTERSLGANQTVSYRPRREQPYQSVVRAGRFISNSVSNPVPQEEIPAPEKPMPFSENNPPVFSSPENTRRAIRSSGPLQPRHRSRQLNAGVCLGEQYRLQRQLGIGQCGETWRASEIDTGNFVTVKTLPLTIQEDRDAINAFLYAVQRVVKLRFPGITPVYKPEKDEVLGQFLVAAYLDALPLNQYCEQYRRTFQNFPMTAVIRILWAVAKSLDFAHQKGITHRVLKSDNIYVGKLCGVMTTDFYLPQVIQAELQRLGQSSEDSETERYVAPEVWMRQAYSPKSDQFSLAVLAVQLISDSLPFQGNNSEELRESILTGEPVLPKDLPIRAENALRKALAKEPEDRFNGCLDFTAELAEFDIPAAQMGNAGTRLRKEGLWAVFGTALLPEPDCVANATLADVFPFKDWMSVPDPEDGIKPDKASYPYLNPPSAVSRKKLHFSGTFWRNLTFAALITSVAGVAAYWGLPLLKERITAPQSETQTAAKETEKTPANNPPAPVPDNNLFRPQEPVRNTPGSDVEPITPEELAELIQSAAENNVNSLRRLGEVHFYGRGVKTDLDKAFNYFKQGSELGDAASLYYLGRYYELGLGGIEQNRTEAVSIYKKAEAKRYQPAIEQLRKLKQ